MAQLLYSLLGIVKVSIISGGAWSQFEKQVLAHLSHSARFENLSLLPTCGTKFYQYDAKWARFIRRILPQMKKQRLSVRWSKQPTLLT